MQDTQDIDNEERPRKVRDNKDGLGRLRAATSVFYDMQDMRMSTANRGRPRDENESVPMLTEIDIEFFDAQSKGIKELEDNAARHIARCLKGVPIYERYLRHQRGVAHTMGAVLITGFDITHSDKPSSYWQYAGLGANLNSEGMPVIQRRMKGIKTNYNPKLKTKLLGVLSSSLFRAYSLDEGGYFFREGSTCKGKKLPLEAFCPVCKKLHEEAEETAAKKKAMKSPKKVARKKAKPAEEITTLEEAGEETLDESSMKEECIGRRKIYVDPTKVAVWRKVCDDRKNFRRAQRVPVCMNCIGKGKCIEEVTEAEKAEGKTDKVVACWNCDGSGANAPWGTSDMHRHRDGLRYMVKYFVLEFIKAWKQLEGLPIRPPYEEEKLGHVTSVKMPWPDAFFAPD